MSLNKPIVILLKTQLAENLGATVRAMANFGLDSLRLVNPCVNLNNKTALSMCVRNENILKNAEIFSSLENALHDIQFAYATTPRKPNINKKINFAHSLEINHSLKTAFIFGCERTGLTNEEIVLCNEIISIDTNNSCSSLNLSQAAIIIFHEWFNKATKSILPSQEFDIAPFKNKVYFLNQLEDILNHINFWRVHSKKEEMWKNIRNTFTKNTYTNQEIKTLTGIINDIKKKIK